MSDKAILEAIKQIDSKIENGLSELDNKITTEVSKLDNKITTEVSKLNNKITTEVSKLDKKITTGLSEVKDDIDGLRSDMDEYRVETNRRLDMLENVGIELQYDIKGLRARQELVEIGIKTSMDDLRKDIRGVDSRIANLETFVGRFVDIVANNLDRVEKDNSKDHSKFREALKLADYF